MAWPSISTITEGIKDFVSGEVETPSTDAAAVEAQPETTTADPKPEETAPTSENADDAPKTDAPAPSPNVADYIKSKGVKSFLDELPEDVRKEIGPAVNREWYTKLNQRDAENKQLRAQVEAFPAVVADIVQNKLDELRKESMTEEERTAFDEKKELARLKAEKDKPKQDPYKAAEDINAQVAQTPFAAEFWKTAQEYGFDPDSDAETLTDIWYRALSFTQRDPDVTTAIDKMKRVVASHPLAKKPAKAETKPDDTAKLIAEAVAKGIDAELKRRGILKADTGKPSSGSGTTKPKTYEDARKAAEEDLKAAMGRS